jgi:hypothetical protein
VKSAFCAVTFSTSRLFGEPRCYRSCVSEVATNFRLSLAILVCAPAPCERLTATIQGSPRFGKLRMRIGSASRAATPFTVIRSAPRPTSPRQINPSAGAPIMPSSGVPLVTSAGLTVNSLRPAEFLGAVKRIDQKEAAAIGRLGQIKPLLGQHGYFGNQTAQTFVDDPVGGQVRLRYRRSVDLAVDLHGAAVDGKNGGADLDHRTVSSISAAAPSRSITGAVETASFISGLHGCSSFPQRSLVGSQLEPCQPVELDFRHAAACSQREFS